MSIVLPGSMPQIFTGIRLAWGISLIVVIAAEMVGATVGIGYMILEAQQTFRTERVFAGIIVIGLLGFVTDLAFRRLRHVLLPWYRETES
jgi:NitT/TauT family transport system permease protein